MTHYITAAAAVSHAKEHAQEHDERAVVALTTGQFPVYALYFDGATIPEGAEVVFDTYADAG